MGCECCEGIEKVDMRTDEIARVLLLNYREDGVTPFVTIWKHGLKEEKV